MSPLPRTPAPALRLPLVGGGTFDLAASAPRLFTLVLFYRGLHCPVCRKQLAEYDAKLEQIREAGLEVVAVSGDTRERAEQTVTDWELAHLPVAHSLDEAGMRAWGLYVSKGVKEPEPALFNEPGLFLVQPDGTLYSAHVQSTPFARPHLDNLLSAVGFIAEKEYPARGEA